MNRYQKYLELKKKDESKLYLFRCGNFYIFLDQDAIEVSEYTTLKLTNYSKNVLKCGFPHETLDKYQKIFKKLNKDVVVEEDEEKELTKEDIKFLNEIKNINLDELRMIDAFNMIVNYRNVK